MKKTKLTFFIALAMILGTASAFAQDVLKPKIAKTIQQNVFEVVVEKIQEDPLSYEKELPLDRIPYQIRMDKFDSIGTAFRLKDGHFYTAAHVLSLQHKSQQDKFYIRSADGKTYKIGNIVKFATDRDFVVFDVIDFDDANAKGLETDKSYKLNSSVFAVGNALGEGIVMRNGLLTSETPENRNGAWKWLRFSAAASPGNSGGPLVTAQGKVIGIVAMKNSSENLNYALPVGEVSNVADNKGEIHSESYYNIPNILTQRFYHTFDFVIDLPKPIEEVRTACYGALEKDTRQLVTELTKDYYYDGKENFAVKDKGNPLLNTIYSPNFPVVTCLNEKGKWGSYSPQDVSTLKLENNGKISAGGMLGAIFSFLKKPDDISVQQYIKDPKLLMDTLSKAFVMSRQVGSEKITITSYGEPVETNSYTDKFGRVWLISAFNVPFADYVVYNYALPLPEGIFNITGMAPTDVVWNGYVYDFEFLADFVVAGYSGTVKEWKEYFEIPESLYPRHKVLKDAYIKTSDKAAQIKFSSIEIAAPKDIINITDTAELSCGLALRPDDKNGLKFEVASIAVDAEQNTNDNTLIYISKDYKPNEDAAKDILDSYKKIESKTIPYDGKPFEHDQKTSVFVTIPGEGFITTLGIIYKGSKMDIIQNSIETLQKNLKEIK
ncbi:S1 family peptidase [Treponema sp.]|uniref:S1 family peptidase n=1 Tax=Treponema sp. TaxID=166 RepID=UPI00298DD1A4|nr:trypsin-like peptidase domain-containing protein [Treponema sp.]MCR5612594.1 trypsin-like peptidase domain-containing protein [Treponema sp.]